MFLARYRSLIAELGIINAHLYLVNKLAQALSGKTIIFRYYLVIQPVPKVPRLSRSRGQSITVQQIEANDPRLEKFPRAPEIFRARFAQGATCICAEKAGVPSGFLWFTLGDYNEDEVRCIFRPTPLKRAAWDFDIYVSPSDRLGLTFVRLWDEATRLMRESGCNWTASRISVFNPASYNSHRRLGARTVGTVLFVVLGGAQVLFSLAPLRLHLSFGPSSTPIIEVAAPELPEDPVSSS
jgi:hypothetical protein